MKSNLLGIAEIDPAAAISEVAPTILHLGNTIGVPVADATNNGGSGGAAISSAGLVADVQGGTGDLNVVQNTGSSCALDVLHIHPAVHSGPSTLHRDKMIRMLAVLGDARHLGLARLARRTGGSIGIAVVYPTGEVDDVADLQRTGGRGGGRGW